MPYSRFILLYIVSYLVTSLAQAQTIDHAEYFFDRDPGLGQAIPITVSSPGGDITLTFAAGISALDPGYHVLYVRSHDISGPWSLNYAHPFYIPDNTAPPAPVDVAYLEYFIDRDPGQGQAVPVNITPGNDITTNFTVPLTDIPTGFHTLYLRSRDQNGQWSVLTANPFYIPDTSSLPDPADLAFLEYYIDQDPGLTQAEAVSITQGQDIAANFAVSLSDIPSGFHTLYVRSRNRYVHWTVNFAHPFYLADTSSLPDPAKIVNMEYFIDNDPGLGNGEAVAITPQTDITVNFVVSLQPVEPGFHTLYIRSQDLKGKWTLTADNQHLFVLIAVTCDRLGSEAYLEIRDPQGAVVWQQQVEAEGLWQEHHARRCASMRNSRSKRVSASWKWVRVSRFSRSPTCWLT